MTIRLGFPHDFTFMGNKQEVSKVVPITVVYNSSEHYFACIETLGNRQRSPTTPRTRHRNGDWSSAREELV